MQFQKFASFDEAQASVAYPILVVDALGGHPRTSAIRWMDEANDMFFQTYAVLEKSPRGTEYLVTRRLIFVQGHGSACNMDVSEAPKGHSGTFTLPDGRSAVWGVGVAKNGWHRAGPVWAGWPCRKRSGSFLRVEAFGFGLNTVKGLATGLSQRES